MPRIIQNCFFHTGIINTVYQPCKLIGWVTGANGNHCLFPVIDGEIVCGGAQDIYLAEFDGPQLRKVYVEVMGE